MPRTIPSAPARPKKATPLPVPATAEDLAERFKDFPAINVVNRRILDPSAPGSLPILLKDEHEDSCKNSDHQNRLRRGATHCHLCRLPARRWYVRWCNTSIEGRWSEYRQMGYLAVPIALLRDAQDISDLVRQKDAETGETWVRRGDRGQEVLMYQPLEGYNARKAAQRTARDARERNPRLMQDDLAEAAGKSDDLGKDRDQAAQMLHDGGIRVETMSRERTTLGEEAAGAAGE